MSNELCRLRLTTKHDLDHWSHHSDSTGTRCVVWLVGDVIFPNACTICMWMAEKVKNEKWFRTNDDDDDHESCVNAPYVASFMANGANVEALRYTYLTLNLLRQWQQQWLSAFSAHSLAILMASLFICDSTYWDIALNQPLAPLQVANDDVGVCRACDLCECVNKAAADLFQSKWKSNAIFSRLLFTFYPLRLSNATKCGHRYGFTHILISFSVFDEFVRKRRDW